MFSASIGRNYFLIFHRPSTRHLLPSWADFEGEGVSGRLLAERVIGEMGILRINAGSRMRFPSKRGDN